MDSDRVQALLRAGELFHQRAWVPGTAGNLSFRIDASTIAITRSGCHKGELSERDIVTADLDGRPREAGVKCSAETLLHCELYRRFANVGSVLHTHSVWATLVSRQRKEAVVLEDYELLKALSGVDSHQVAIRVPIFGNDQDIPRLARKVASWLDVEPAPHAYLIAGHGLYAWGETIEIARYRIEAIEFLLECEHRRSDGR